MSAFFTLSLLFKSLQKRLIISYKDVSEKSDWINFKKSMNGGKTPGKDSLPSHFIK